VRRAAKYLARRGHIVNLLAPAGVVLGAAWWRCPGSSSRGPPRGEGASIGLPRREVAAPAVGQRGEWGGGGRRDRSRARAARRAQGRRTSLPRAGRSAGLR
jgi:hypothetical protein